MISIGFNAAASMRVSNELGAGHAKSASFSVFVVTTKSVLISIISAAVVLSLRDYISYIFTDGEPIANAVSDLCPILALTLLLNGVQPVLSGVAIGRQSYAAYINVWCYYILGVPLGALFVFFFNFGAKGIWTGMLCGTVMQTIILMWATFRSDWNKEVVNAKNRLEKLEEE